MDDMDHAQTLADALTKKAISDHNAALTVNTQGREDCIDCDEPIPEARRSVNPTAQRCADCQNEVESKS